MFNFNDFKKDRDYNAMMESCVSFQYTENYSRINEGDSPFKAFDDFVKDNPYLKGFVHKVKKTKLEHKYIKDLQKAYDNLYKYDFTVDKKIELAKKKAKEQNKQFDERTIRDKFAKGKEVINAKIQDLEETIRDDVKGFDDLEKEFTKLKKKCEIAAKIQLAKIAGEDAHKILGISQEEYDSLKGEMHDIDSELNKLQNDIKAEDERREKEEKDKADAEIKAKVASEIQSEYKENVADLRSEFESLKSDNTKEPSDKYDEISSKISTFVKDYESYIEKKSEYLTKKYKDEDPGEEPTKPTLDVNIKSAFKDKGEQQ